MFTSRMKAVTIPASGANSCSPCGSLKRALLPRNIEFDHDEKPGCRVFIEMSKLAGRDTDEGCGWPNESGDGDCHLTRRSLSNGLLHPFACSWRNRRRRPVKVFFELNGQPRFVRAATPSLRWKRH